MARKNNLDPCFPIIEDYFNKHSLKSFTENKFSAILSNNRSNWKVPNNKYSKQILQYLINKNVLLVNIFSDASNENKFIYSWETQDVFTIISGLKSDSYFAYYTALYLHQLSLQIPKTIYLNFERKSGIYLNNEEDSLTQEAIDNAFQKSQRKSSRFYSYMDKKIILTNGKNTGRLGVVKMMNREQYFEYTDLERTLIDISVRPVYSGGVFEVMEAYRLAKGKLDIKKMAHYLTQLNYIYPYHQVIGFYMDKTNYSEKEINYFIKEKKFKFYLTYDIRNVEFSKKWQLYYPKGI